jgi:hypothetical protein
MQFEIHSCAVSCIYSGDKVHKFFTKFYAPIFFPQYFLLVMVVFVVMLVGGILGYVFRETVHNSMEQEMQASLRQYGEKRAITNAWDSTQETVINFS